MNRIRSYIYSFIFLALICPNSLYAQAVSGTLNGHDYVDLGLSVKWATCNVGASKPSDYGNYYAWGETEIKSSYTADNCETWEEHIGDIGYTSRDVAHVKWDGSWRMPTEAEFEELLDENNCDWTWIAMNGVNGYKVTSKKPGYKDNYIFLPASGRYHGESSNFQSLFGYYWNSTSGGGGIRAYDLDFQSGSHSMYWSGRYDGYSVRPVTK